MPKKKFKFTKVSKKKTKKPKYSFEYVPEKIVDKKVSQSGEVRSKDERGVIQNKFVCLNINANNKVFKNVNFNCTEYQ